MCAACSSPPRGPAATAPRDARCGSPAGGGRRRVGKPIDFDGWLDDPPGPPAELAFWVRYWVAAHRFVLEHAPPTAVTPSYARLTERPEAALDPVLPRPALVPPGPHPRRDGGRRSPATRRGGGVRPCRPRNTRWAGHHSAPPPRSPRTDPQGAPRRPWRPPGMSAAMRANPWPANDARPSHLDRAVRRADPVEATPGPVSLGERMLFLLLARDGPHPGARRPGERPPARPDGARRNGSRPDGTRCGT